MRVRLLEVAHSAQSFGFDGFVKLGLALTLGLGAQCAHLLAVMRDWELWSPTALMPAATFMWAGLCAAKAFLLICIPIENRKLRSFAHVPCAQIPGNVTGIIPGEAAATTL